MKSREFWSLLYVLMLFFKLIAKMPKTPEKAKLFI